MDDQSILEILMREDPRIDFVLLRHGRNMIKSGPMRERLVHMPQAETTCPVQAALFRRAGIRMATLDGEF